MRIGKSLLRILELVGLGMLATLIAASAVALRHLLDTPQPLESILPGDAHIYRWKYGHIFYKVLGAPDTPPLVLFHSPEIGASTYEMRKIIGALAQNYRVYAPDLLGFGLSDRPEINYTAETYISFCQDFLKEVVGRPSIVVASGLSCNYAVATAQLQPELCERLVLISPTELFGKKHRQDFLTELSQVEAVGLLLYPIMSTRTALRYRLARQKQLDQQSTPAFDVDYLYASTHQFGGRYAPMALMGGKLEVNTSQQFESLQQPTLIIWGIRALNETQALTSQNHISKQTQMVLIQNAGTYVHEEYPTTVVANISQWIAEGETEEKLSPTHTPVALTQPGQEHQNTEASEQTPNVDVSEHSTQAYCVKCKQKREMQNPQEIQMKNGRPAVQGTCQACGTKLYRIGRLQVE